MSVSELVGISAISGPPFAYGLDGRPVSRQDAARLLADVEHRTLHKSELKLATGEWVTVRTVAMVFDPDLNAGELVSADYRPKLWGTALYTPAPESALLEVLCTYDDAEAAVEEHEQAMAMVACGTNDGSTEPCWSSELSWTGPGQ